jgi:S-adenosylmethionine decarboxylase proenzyme
MKTIGRHLIAEYYGCPSPLLNEIDKLRGFMIHAAKTVGATVLGETFHSFSPQGASGTVVIAESHLSIHTWPEHGYVAVDIYTCGGLDPRPGFEYLARMLEAKSYRVQEILRGLPEDLDSHGMLLPEDVSIITRLPETRVLSGVGAAQGA